MSDIYINAQNGDINAFAKIYSKIYTNLYYLAYYSLANQEEAVDAVKNASYKAYSMIRDCDDEEEFNGLLLKKLCEQIIKKFREYGKVQPEHEKKPSYIKFVMRRLTDAERISAALWAIFGLDVKEISMFSGISEKVVTEKLNSAMQKLETSLREH